MCLCGIDYQQVRPIDAAVKDILMDLPLQCTVCFCDGPYLYMASHVCDDRYVNVISQALTTVSTKSEESKTVDSSIQTTPLKKLGNTSLNRSIDNSIQTTPSDRNVTISLKRSLTSPLNKHEEKVHIHLTNRKLTYSSTNIIQCKTGGPSLYLMKVAKARQLSETAKSPLKRKIARMISEYRTFTSGKGTSSSSIQQSSELKILTKKSKLTICENAGVRQKAVLTTNQQLAIKSALNFSWYQSRTFKRFCRTAGVKFDSVRKERE